MTWRTRRWLVVAGGGWWGGVAKGVTGPWGSALLCLLPCATWRWAGVAWGELQQGCKHISRSVSHACSYLLALPAGALGKPGARREHRGSRQGFEDHARGKMGQERRQRQETRQVHLQHRWLRAEGLGGAPATASLPVS